MLVSIWMTLGALVVIPVAICTLRRLDDRVRRRAQLDYLCGPVRRQRDEMVSKPSEPAVDPGLPRDSESQAEPADVVAVPIAPVGLLTFQPGSFTQTP